MTSTEFKEKLEELGIDFAMTFGKFIVPCPSPVHNESVGGKRANVAMGETTGFGKCYACDKNWKFEDMVSALETSSYVGAIEDEKEPPPHFSFLKMGFAPKLLSVGNILKTEYPEAEFLVNGILPIPSINTLSGVPGDYKTWVTMHLALCVARGLPLFGQFPSKQGPVLVIDEEMYPKHLKRRFQSLGFEENDPIHYLSLTGFKVDNKLQVEKIVSYIRDNGFKLVIVDSLIRVHGQDENSSNGMAKVMDGFKELAKEDAAVLFTHHHRKQTDWKSGSSAQSLRGSSDILAGIDSLFMLEKKKDEDVLIFRQAKARHTEAITPFEISVLKNENGVVGFEYMGSHDEKKKKSEDAAEAVKKVLQEKVVASRKQIIDILNEEFGEKAIDAGLKIASKNGEVELVPKNERPVEFSGSALHCYRIAVAKE